MRHELVQDDLKAYCDGELGWLRRLAVQRHLAQCADCRQEVHAMQQLHDTLRAAEEDDTLSPALRERILSHTPDDDARPAVAPAHRSRFNSPAFAWGAAAVVLLAWFVLFPVFNTAREKARQLRPEVGPYAQSQKEVVVRKPVAQPLAVRDGGNPIVTTYDSSAGGPTQYQRFVPPPSPKPALNSVSGNELVPDTSLRQVHKEATMTVLVADPEAKSDSVEQTVKAVGGYVAENELTTDDDGLKSAQMTVKVPEPQFETILAQVARLGDVQAKDITGEDITEKTSDAAQAEGVLEDEVQRSDAHLKQLGSRARWGDEEQAREVRIELAQARARLVLLHKIAALSTLSITLNEKPKPTPPAATGFTSQLTDTTHHALQSVIASAGALLALLIWLLAYAPLWVPILFLVRYFRRRKAVPAP